MPHKPAPRTTEKTQFISTNLTPEMRHELANWASDNRSKCLDFLADAVQSGYRVSIKPEEAGYSANMSTTSERMVNKSLVLIERATSPERALLRLLWAHYSLYKLIWPRSQATEDEDW